MSRRYLPPKLGAKLTFAAFILLLTSNLQAASDNLIEAVPVPPTIPKGGNTKDDFVPSGYSVFESVEGDFNGDGITDIAMVLWQKTQKNELDPRPVVILFGKPHAGYTLSARNDHIAPTGIGGGTANPHGADAIKLKGRTIFIQDWGGGGDSVSGSILGFRWLNGGWYQVSTASWVMRRNGEYSLECPANVAPKASHAWRCVRDQTDTDLITGHEVETWTLYNNKTDKEREKRFQRTVIRRPLHHFENLRTQNIE